MIRIAIPIERGKLSEYLENCMHFEIFDIDRENIKKNFIKIPSNKLRAEIPEWLAKIDITDLIIHKTDNQLLKMLQSYKINLFIGVGINFPDVIINDYLDGKLCSDDLIISEITDKQKKYGVGVYRKGNDKNRK